MLCLSIKTRNGNTNIRTRAAVQPCGEERKLAIVRLSIIGTILNLAINGFIFVKNTLRKHYHNGASIYCPDILVRLKLHCVLCFVHGVQLVNICLGRHEERRESFTIEYIGRSRRQITAFFMWL